MTAIVATCAGCGPSQYQLAMRECGAKYKGDALAACIYQADADHEARAASVLGAGSAINAATAVAAPAPQQAALPPASAPGVPQTYKVSCNDMVGVTGQTTCKVRQ
jgi:hypothetical protein